MKYNVILYTLGNVIVADNTVVTYWNDEPDLCVGKRSQEFYDAINDRFNVVAWACGRYGQREYSKDLGVLWRKKIENFLEQVRKSRVKVDFAIQMVGHPTMVQPYPYFILTILCLGSM